MSRLGQLWSKIEGSNRANCDSSNQQFIHGALLSSNDGDLLPPCNFTKLIAQASLGHWVKVDEARNGPNG
jgi:hypothetical protein